MNYDRAVAAWIEALGSDVVDCDQKQLEFYEQATFALSFKVRCLLRPTTCEQVQTCLRIANQYHTPIYPISRGQNVGLGSRSPVSDGCAMLDLSQMRRIEVDEEMAYLTVEPGVSFGQAWGFLEKRNSQLMLETSAGPREGSLIGNALDRGHGFGPNTDRFDTMCALQVVLADGSLLETDYASFSNSKVGNLAQHGCGPSVAGLFSQSGLGVVVRATFLLRPKPAVLLMFYCGTDEIETLEKIVDAARKLSLSGLDWSFRLFNALKFLAFSTQYPWEETGGETPLPESIHKKLREKEGMRLWNGFGALFARSQEEVRAQAKIVRQAFAAVDDFVFFSDDFNSSGQLSDRFDQRFIELIRGTFLGMPVQFQATSMCYWRKQELPNRVNPEQDGCGFYWVCPTLPCKGKSVSEALALIEKCLAKHGYESNLGLLFTQPRTIAVTIALAFDRDIPGEDSHARACYDELLSNLIDNGFPPYRLSIASQQKAFPGREDFDRVHGILKDALDPHGIIAPGRYAGGR